MFNNINDNNDLLFNSQFNVSNVVNLSSIRANTKTNGYNNNPYVDKSEISSDALKLFQKDLDVKKFTKLITDNKDDISYLEKMHELFSSGVVDAYEDDIISELATNEKLLDDLNL